MRCRRHDVVGGEEGRIGAGIEGVWLKSFNDSSLRVSEPGRTTESERCAYKAMHTLSPRVSTENQAVALADADHHTQKGGHKSVMSGEEWGEDERWEVGGRIE